MTLNYIQTISQPLLPSTLIFLSLVFSQHTEYVTRRRTSSVCKHFILGSVREKYNLGIVQKDYTPLGILASH